MCSKPQIPHAEGMHRSMKFIVRRKATRGRGLEGFWLKGNLAVSRPYESHNQTWSFNIAVSGKYCEKWHLCHGRQGTQTALTAQQKQKTTLKVDVRFAQQNPDRVATYRSFARLLTCVLLQPAHQFLMKSWGVCLHVCLLIRRKKKKTSLCNHKVCL